MGLTALITCTCIHPSSTPDTHEFSLISDVSSFPDRLYYAVVSSGGEM